jgi:hypothetical protein
MQDEAFYASEKAYEEQCEAKRKKDQKEMIDGQKKIAAGTFTGRTRECKDCGKTFPWQARKVQCLQCFKNSKSSSPVKKNTTRTCQDCGDSMDARSEPVWKVRCMDCWRKNKTTGDSNAKQSPSSNNNSQSRKCLDCSATIDAHAPKNKVRCYTCWKKRNGR